MPILLLLAAALTHLAKTPPPCHPYQLSLNTDQENGSFNGMSHGGVLLVLRNLSTQPCTLPAYPPITFSTSNQALPTRSEPIEPATLGQTNPTAIAAPGAELTAILL